jgi:hypothetical protein
MDISFGYIVSAAAGGLIGGLGHALVSSNPGFGSVDPSTGKKDFSGFTDLAVGFFTGLVWLLPNQSTWVNQTPKSLDQLVLIALQTMVIGLAGSGWLTSYLDSNSLEQDKTALKGAVAKAAAATANPGLAGQISQASSVDAIVGLVSKL